MQPLCKVWSGEAAAYTFATESAIEIAANTPFSILGATQIPNSANVILRMDKGHGLLNRFLVSVPLALKPTPKQEEEASEYLASLACNDFATGIIKAIEKAPKDIVRTYALDSEAFQIHSRLKTYSVHEVNRAIKNAEVPYRSGCTSSSLLEHCGLLYLHASQR